jgi:hypothetical protein
VLVTKVDRLALPLVCKAEVAAPEGKGKDAAETGTVLFGLTATTIAVSVAVAEVDAAFIVAVRAPSFSIVVCVLIVV